ncbi:MAG: ATP-binding protein [Thermotogae bacterium]|nr:ATP-binding protein [Thermotogota bacterium]
MFYDREEEKKFLKAIKNKDEKAFVVMYGRRRVGKTTLVKNVFQNEAMYFFVEVKRSETLLSDFSKRISRGIFQSWYDFFLELFEKHKIIIFDEFQNFYKVDKNILYALQHAWDETRSNTKLIALGSYIGLIKKLFTDEKMPLFGRKDYIVKLKPFSVKDSIIILKGFGYTTEEALKIYSMVGGIPPYLLLFKEKKSMRDLIYHIFTNPFAPLKDEAKNILVLEFGSEHRGYFSILEAIGAKNLTLSEISDFVQIEPHKLSKYLGELENEYQIVDSLTPIFYGRKRRRYRIVDNYYNFFFQMIYKLKDLVEYSPEKAAEIIYSDFSSYMGLAFENICREYISQNHELIGFVPKKIGKSWGKAYGKKESFDIDIVAYDDENVLFGECKWTNKKVGVKSYIKLLERRSYLKVGKRTEKFMIISKSGFTEDLLKIKDENLLLLTIDDMF